MNRFRKPGLHAIFAPLATLVLMTPQMDGAQNFITAQLCDSSGRVRTVSIPLPDEQAPDKKHCAKACHAICARKKPAKQKPA